jgi:hypothetical protein
MRTITITLKDIAKHGTIAEAIMASPGGVYGEATVSIPEPTVRAAMKHPGAFLAWLVDGPRFGLAPERANAVADAVLGAYEAIAMEAKRKTVDEKAKKKAARPSRAIDSAVERHGVGFGVMAKKPWEVRRDDTKKVQRRIGSMVAAWKLGLEEMP